MKNQTPNLGDQELALLRYVADNEPLSAGQVSGGYGEANGLARSTVETMMERLRKKGLLRRRQVDGVYKYETAIATHDLLGGLVGQFVERTLGGSLTPFVTYFSQRNELSPSELSQLEALVEKLQSKREEGGS